jgi:hypothetical protein
MSVCQYFFTYFVLNQNPLFVRLLCNPNSELYVRNDQRYVLKLFLELRTLKL